MSETNPGQQLRDFLKQIYPFDLDDINAVENNFFVYKIDNALIAEGNFANLLYESSINYILRRLINTAEYLRRKYESDTFPPGKFLVELRRFITDHTRINSDDAEKIIALLNLCVEAKNKKLKPSRKKRIVRNAKSNNELSCYICGKALTSEEVEIKTIKENQTDNNLPNQEEVQIEHIWPRAMGGATEDFNLKISCSYCNNKKQNYIDASDFHYEQISLVSDKNDEFFSTELKREYKIAIWSKSNYSCSVCGKPALSVGRLNFGRLNPNDSWHFLNIEAYCDKHTPE
jgi:5-methylcytosine-specific restriction endonuclease McrA